ncbi:MAG: TRAP transporter small permease [Pseudomonadota bacterium]
MMKPIGNLIEKMADLGGYFSGWLVPLMMILVVVEVFMRYVMQKPLMIADEFSAYMLVAISYLGLAYTWKQGGHVRITLLVGRLHSSRASWVRLFTLILAFLFLLSLTQAGYTMIVYALEADLRSETFFTFPLFWPQLTVFIGFILLTLQLALEIVRAIAGIRAGGKVGEKIE